MLGILLEGIWFDKMAKQYNFEAACHPLFMQRAVTAVQSKREKSSPDLSGPQKICPYKFPAPEELPRFGVKYSYLFSPP